MVKKIENEKKENGQARSSGQSSTWLEANMRLIRLCSVVDFSDRPDSSTSAAVM